MRLRAVFVSKAVQSQAACVLLLVELFLISLNILLLVDLLITLNTFKLSSALLCFAPILNSENVQPCTKHAFVCKCAGAAVVQAPEIQLSVNCNSERDFFAIASTGCIFLQFTTSLLSALRRASICFTCISLVLKIGRNSKKTTVYMFYVHYDVHLYVLRASLWY